MQCDNFTIDKVTFSKVIYIEVILKLLGGEIMLIFKPNAFLMFDNGLNSYSY